jgi:glycosyltransferase involved in cell wall biosynthesis
MMTTFYPPYSFGGDAVYIHRLVNELARRGHEVDVVHCADAYRALAAGVPDAAVPHHANVQVHTLHSRLGLLSPLLTQQTGRAGLKGRAIRRLIESRRYDVVHAHNMSLIGLDVLQWGDAVRLYTTHEHWLVCPTHVLFRYNREVCTTPTCFSCQLRAGRPPQLWRHTGFADRQLAHVDRFLCPSRFTLNKHREMGFTGPMTHLPYFLPRDESAVAGEPPHPRPYALFVGRLERIKGVQNLLRVFRRYRGCDLVIVGTGEHESDLRRDAADLPHVHFLGRLPYEQIRAWYRHAVASLVPSICYEVFGIVILESFADSTPAVVTPLGALPEVIAESGGGIVYSTDDELVDAVERLRADPDLRARLGSAGRDAYLRLWCEDPHIARYLGIIEEIVASKGARSGGGVAHAHRH